MPKIFLQRAREARVGDLRLGSITPVVYDDGRARGTREFLLRTEDDRRATSRSRSSFTNRVPATTIWGCERVQCAARQRPRVRFNRSLATRSVTGAHDVANAEGENLLMAREPANCPTIEGETVERERGTLPLPGTRRDRLIRGGVRRANAAPITRN